MSVPRLRSLLPCLLLGACQLTETVVSAGQRTVVVHAVLDRNQLLQFAVVEESSVGDTASFGGGSTVPPDRPRFPVTGAQVSLLTEQPGCCVTSVSLGEVLPTAPSVLPTGRYVGNTGILQPGQRVRLRVALTDGREVTGETVVPGATRRTVQIGTQSARFPMDTLVFHRERDTLRVSVDAAGNPGGGIQVEARRADDHDQLAALFFNDSLGVAFPGNLVNPFEGDSGETLFRAGTYYLLTVALADSNYFDFARTFSDPITGRGFLNYLKGGIGVFGSVETASYLLRIVASVNDPREGAYRLTGRVGNNTYDATLEAYLDDLSPRRFSAFVRGDAWPNGPFATSGDGTWGAAAGGPPGARDEFTFSFIVRRTNPPVFRRYQLRGIRSGDGSPFPVSVIGTNQGGNTVLNATFTAVQLSGPGTP